VSVQKPSLLKVRNSKLTWPLQRFFRRVGLSIVSNTSELEGQLYLRVNELGLRWCIDVGAHHGEFIERLQRIDVDLRILAIEPSHKAARVLIHKNFKNVNVVEIGLGLIESRTKLYESGSVFASVKKRKDRLTQTGSETVQIRRLDKLINEFPHIELNKTLLKLDTQGSELEILKGSEKLLELIPLVLVEVPLNSLYSESFSIEDILSFMKERSFIVSSINTPRFNNGKPYDCDILFSKE
jgi:FkbM family methyltransferase